MYKVVLLSLFVSNALLQNAQASAHNFLGPEYEGQPLESIFSSLPRSDEALFDDPTLESISDATAETEERAIPTNEIAPEENPQTQPPYTIPLEGNIFPLPFPYKEIPTIEDSNDATCKDIAYISQGTYLTGCEENLRKFLMLGPLCPCIGIIARSILLNKPPLVAHMDVFTDVTSLKKPIRQLGIPKEDLELIFITQRISETEWHAPQKEANNQSYASLYSGRSQDNVIEDISRSLQNLLGIPSDRLTTLINTTDYSSEQLGQKYFWADEYFAIDKETGEIFCTSPIAEDTFSILSRGILEQFPSPLPIYRRMMKVLSIIITAHNFEIMIKRQIESKITFNNNESIHRHIGTIPFFRTDDLR